MIRFDKLLYNVCFPMPNRIITYTYYANEDRPSHVAPTIPSRQTIEFKGLTSTNNSAAGLCGVKGRKGRDCQSCLLNKHFWSNGYIQSRIVKKSRRAAIDCLPCPAPMFVRQLATITRRVLSDFDQIAIQVLTKCDVWQPSKLTKQVQIMILTTLGCKLTRHLQKLVSWA